ncbi:MAG: ATP-binding protein [Methanocorpusculum sp.]|nr:ATP-binding protein [Methanocorpusculum sp.]
MADTTGLMLRQNPWWSGKPIDTGIIRENYLNKIIRYIDTKEIIIIGGVRRAGKTKLMHQTINHLITNKKAKPEEILFISCDAPEVQKLSDPIEEIIDTFRKQTGNPNLIWLFLDEVQMIQDFPARLKALYDEGNTRIIISGSSSHLLESKAGTLLSGRYIPITVYPLSFSEYLKFKSFEIPKTNLSALSKRYEFISELNEYLNFGGFPAVVNSDNNDTKGELINAYYDSIVFRDIIQAHGIHSSGLLSKILHYLITNVSLPMSYKGLSKLFECSPITVQDYLNGAEDANLLFPVKFFSYSLKEQIRNEKKMYVIDNGLRNRVSFTFSQDTGRLAENAVCIELMRHGFEPFYWKEGNTTEVDFVVQSDDSLICINVCYSDDIPAREFKGLTEFENKHSYRQVKKIILSEDTEKTEGDIVIQPIWKWFSGLEKLGEIV